VVVLGFVSDMFTAGGTVPGWLDGVGWFFPLRHLVALLRVPLDPFAAVDAAWPHLLVLVGWGLVGAVVAALRFRWAPHQVGARRRPARTGTVRRRSATSLVLGQFSHAVRSQWRDPGSWFFAVAFPAVLFALLSAVLRDEVQEGLAYPQALLPGVLAYGVAVTAFVNLPEATATARDRGVLRRLRGTPLPAWAHLAGRAGAAFGMGLITAAPVLAVAVGAFGVRVAPAGIPALVLVLAVGAACLLAVGTGLAALIRTARAYAVVSLSVLLPLSFLSGLFPLGVAEPAVVHAVASALPLQHFADALDEALRATSWTPVAWQHFAVLVAWGVVGTVAAARRGAPADR
jgi:ABC-type multidrug transport system permease subunit